MKTLTLSLLLLTFATQAFAADELRTVYRCSSLDSGPDHGVSLEIRTGGIAGLTFADVSESTIVGEIAIGGVSVVSSSTVTHNTLYSGPDFKLLITHTRASGNNGFRAALKATLAGRVLNEGMSCTLLPVIQPAPIASCHAIYNGANFSASGVCVLAIGGCITGPQPQYRSIQACQSAHGLVN